MITATKDDVYLDEGLQGWIEKTARKEYWRVESWYELRDLVQDGYICYVKCRNKYALQPPDPGHTDLNTRDPSPLQRRHFMNLVKSAFGNHIWTLSSRFALLQESAMSKVLEDDSPAALERLLPVEAEATSLCVLLTQAPAEIREAVEILVKDGLEGGEYLRTRLFSDGNRIRRGRSPIRETTRERWQRLLGDPDLPDKVAAYLRA